MSIFLILWRLDIGRDDISRLTVFDFLRTCRTVSRETCHFPSPPVSMTVLTCYYSSLAVLIMDSIKGLKGCPVVFDYRHWASYYVLIGNLFIFFDRKKNVSVSFAHFEVRLFEEFDVDIRSPSCKRSERGSFQSLYSLCLLGIPTVIPSNSIYLVPVLAWHTKPLPNPSPCRFPINKT